MATKKSYFFIFFIFLVLSSINQAFHAKAVDTINKNKIKEHRKIKLLQFFLLSLGLCTLISCGNSYKGYKNSPYTVRGQRYYPLNVEDALHYKERGIASWYDESQFFGLKRGNTALGEKVMPLAVSGAHKTLPLPCVVKVTNLENGKTLKLRLNDRGPYIPERIIDVTPRAANKLGFKKQGLTRVEVEVISVGDGFYKQKKKRTKRFFFF